jgi:formate dehydrogenase (coenzyme F420) beta subunit
MIDTIRVWIEKGEVDLFLGYKLTDGHPLPHAFNRRNLKSLDQMVMGPTRYPLEKIAAEILATNREMRIGLLVRDCNRRALKVLFINKQLEPEQVRMIDLNCCPSKLHTHADCSYLVSEPGAPFKQQVGIDKGLSPGDVDRMPDSERFSRWMYEFQKCIKCYGCRNICPVCFCSECALENPDLVELGPLPPEVPIFHVVRAVHMAGRCVDCGLCEDACPMDIPLRLLYRKGNELVKELFDYQPGISPGPSPFGAIGDPLDALPRADHEAA